AEQIRSDEDATLIPPGEVADPVGKGDLAGQIAPIGIDGPQRGDPLVRSLDAAEKEDAAAIGVENHVIEPGWIALWINAARSNHLGDGEHDFGLAAGQIQ